MSESKKAKTQLEDAGLPDPAEDEEVQQKLREVQEKLFKLNEEASDKVLEIEQQYSRLRRPMYDERREILQVVPQFWQRALLQHPDLRTAASEDDVAVLGYCTELNVEDFDDIKSGYRIVFKFSENPYFSNQELVKTFSYQEGANLHVKSTKPEWKEGYEPTDDPDPDSVGNGGSKRSRGRSYKLMDWFSVENDILPSASQDELAEIIKEEIWPDPLKFYNGEVELDEAEGLDLEGEGEEGEEEELEGQEFDDEEAALEYEGGGDEGEEEGDGDDEAQ